MESSLVDSWPFWAILSAIFAALTAIFAKVGVRDVSQPLFLTPVRAMTL